jgi:hypothetical protein
VSNSKYGDAAVGGDGLDFANMSCLNLNPRSNNSVIAPFAGIESMKESSSLLVLTTPFVNGPLSASVTFPLLLLVTIVNVGGGKLVVNDVVDLSALLSLTFCFLKGLSSFVNDCAPLEDEEEAPVDDFC